MNKINLYKYIIAYILVKGVGGYDGLIIIIVNIKRALTATLRDTHLAPYQCIKL